MNQYHLIKKIHVLKQMKLQVVLFMLIKQLVKNVKKVIIKINQFVLQ